MRYSKINLKINVPKLSKFAKVLVFLCRTDSGILTPLQIHKSFKRQCNCKFYKPEVLIALQQTALFMKTKAFFSQHITPPPIYVGYG